MKRLQLSLLLLSICIFANAQQTLTLEDCRNLALENNKQLKINAENIKKAELEKKAAFTQYLPDFSATGAYFYNQKNISLLDADKYLPIGTVMADGSFGFTPEQINNQWTMVGGTAVPLDANGNPFNPASDPSKILWKEHAIIPKSQFEIDIHNVFAGAVSVVQPIFMGGKIIAYNKITDYAKQLAENIQDAGVQDVIMQVDEAYWQTVSLVNKVDLSNNLVELLQQMDHDVQAMINEGVATKADGLSVKVKLNEAEMTQTQVSNGLQLSRMLLYQICGIPLHEEYSLADESADNIQTDLSSVVADVNEAYSNRPELKSLDLATKIYEKKEAVTRADMLPNIALVGNYMVSNPNSFNGFENKFAGMWNVGVMVNIPIFHWGEKRHKLSAAKAETRIKYLEMDEAREKIELQVNREAFKVNESLKKLKAAEKNKENAEENLRYANVGFKEGVISTTNLMEAQTAWYKAHSDLIDAQIENRLSKLMFTKALGTLEVK